MYAEKVFDQIQLPLRIITINKLTWILSEVDKMSSWGTTHPISQHIRWKTHFQLRAAAAGVKYVLYTVIYNILEAIANIVGSRIKLGK